MALWQLLSFGCLLVLLSNTSSLTISNTSKGLYNCVAANVPIGDCGESAVEVLNISAVVHPCCRRGRGCAACLQVRIWLQVAAQDDEGGDDDDDDGGGGEEGSSTEGEHVTRHMARGQKSASLKVCSTVPSQLTRCQCVECGVSSNHGNGNESLVLERDVPFGGMLHVTAKANHIVKNVTARESTVCKKRGCRDAGSDPPKLVPKVDLEKGEVKMKVENRGQIERTKSRSVHMCSKPKRSQLCKSFNGTLPLRSITPCLCFQAWWMDKDDRSENCPFSGQNWNINLPKGLLEKNVLANVSTSLGLGRTHSGVAALWYNVSVACQGTVEVWPCHMAAAGLCQDVMGSRHLYKAGDRAWTMATNGLWVLSGAFESIHSNLPPCIKVKVMDKELGPWCVEYTRRWHWSIPIFALMMILGLFALGLYVKRTTLEKYFQKWQRTSLLQGGRGHVLLLHPPCGEGAGEGAGKEASMSELVLQLGSALKALGFSVSLDLWSHTELGSVGPVPWLHAQMELLRTRGGRAVLVLSRGALERAEEWSLLGRGEGGDMGPRSGGGVCDGGGGQHEEGGRYGGGTLEEGGEVGGLENGEGNTHGGGDLRRIERGGDSLENSEQGGGGGVIGPPCSSSSSSSSSSSPSPTTTEVFSTALSCLWEDHRRGCAHRHFSLVQFDSHSPFATPPLPHGPGRSTTSTLPPLFQGLSFYSLPRDSRAFVRGVMAQRQGGDGVLERCWQSRWMSRELRRRLQNAYAPAAGTGEHLSRVLEENPGETVPLQP